MATVTFTLPKQWEDWVNWALGFWLCLSPWILGYANESSATKNATLVGFLLILTEAVTLSAFEPWEEWLNIALGSWLFLSGWILGSANTAAGVNFVVVGLMVIALAAFEMWQLHQTRRQ
jgi:hypothetical protein